MPPTNNGSTKDVQPPVVPVVHHESISEPVNAPVSASRPNQKASIPFPSRRNDERRREKANDQIEKFYEIFRDLRTSYRKNLETLADFLFHVNSPGLIHATPWPILVQALILCHTSIALDYEDSRARGFVLRSLELQSLA
ncbi:hypothetical protein Tco_1192698 [Tanacetum coccineum]